MSQSWLVQRSTSVIIQVWVQPNARVSGVVGLHGEALKIKVRAPPVDGAANDALEEFLSQRLGVPRKAISLIKGARERQKTLIIEGVTCEDVQSILVV